MAQSYQKVFGAGRFWGYPVGTAPTPTAFGLTQNMSLDFRRDVKRLYGANQLPADVAAGMLQVTGKATFAVQSGRMLNDLMLGATKSTGQKPWIANESATISGSSAAPSIVSVANTTSWSADLGVRGTVFGSSNTPFTRIASTAPSSGQYFVSSSTPGVYTFSTLDGGAAVAISYLYAATGGETVTMSNQAMGKTGNFVAVMGLLWGTEKGTIQLNNCMATDYGIQTVLDDYAKPTFGFEAAADDADNLGIYSFAEIN